MRQLLAEWSADHKRLARSAKRIIAGLLVRFLLSAVTCGAASPMQGSTSARASLPTGGAASQADARELKQDQPVERQLGGGEAHVYLIALIQGQYLHVIVEQKGVDVVVSLFGPDGKKLTEVDSPNGTQGPEPVYFIAEATGAYRLEVRSLEEKAAPAPYEIKIEALRQAVAKDYDRVAAERTFLEAEQLRVQGTAESLRKAIDKYEETLPLQRKLEDRLGEATTLNLIGVRYWDLGDNQKALAYYGQALPLFRALGKPKEEARVLHNFGTAYWELGDSQKALEYYNQALPLSRAAGDRYEEAINLNTIGLAYDNLGRLREALDYFDQALELLRTLGSRQDEAVTLTSLGYTYFKLGDLQKALAYFSQSLPLRRETSDRRGEASSLNNIGVVYWRLGDYQKALEYYNRALPLRRETGDRNGEVSTLHNLGVVHKWMGEADKARAYYDQALALARAIGDRRDEAAILQELGILYQSFGESQKALEYYNQSLSLEHASGNRWAEALTLSHIGDAYIALGKPDEALTYLEQALSLQRAVGDRGYEAVTLQSIARAERSRGRLDQARAQIEAALKLIESTRSQLVSQELRASYLASNQEAYEIYIDLLMRLHRSQPRAGHDTAALEASERARARGLLDLLTESRADIRQGVDVALLERERSAQQQLNAKSERLTRLFSGKHTEEQASAAKKEIEAALSEYQDVEAEIRARSPRYAALTQPQPLGLRELQQRVVDEDTLLLEYALGEAHSYLWAVTPTSVHSFELPARADIEAAARRFYELLTHNENRQPQAQALAAAGLSRMLLGPAAAQLAEKRLLIVGDGAIQYVPFAALPEPADYRQPRVSHQQAAGTRQAAERDQPLVVRHEILQLPSASVLAVLRRELAGRQPSAGEVAVLADPVFQDQDPRVKRAKAPTSPGPQTAAARDAQAANLKPDVKRSAWESGLEELERLPYSRREAEAIIALAPQGQSLKALDFDASREAVMSDRLAHFRIVHLATHGLLNNLHPELSGLVLSLVDESGQPQNGFVRLHDIYNLKLPAELVVLSACQTALGKEVKGEGLVGLTRGFMYAGAARVVVSLWPINDEATAQFMSKFYQGMLKQGLRPAAALRAAQIAMWKSRLWDAPYYWAGFVMQGEWR
jgi:CHAT domain-containing protein/tetratricopeptide (TPR) repeat protein